MYSNSSLLGLKFNSKLLFIYFLSLILSVHIAGLFSTIFHLWVGNDKMETFGPTIITTGKNPRLQLIFSGIFFVTFYLSVQLIEKYLKKVKKHQIILAVMAIPTTLYSISFSKHFIDRFFLWSLLIAFVLLLLTASAKFQSPKIDYHLLNLATYSTVLVFISILFQFKNFPFLLNSVSKIGNGHVVSLICCTLISSMLGFFSVRERGKGFILSLIGALIYLVSIPWQQISWQSDGFHDSEYLISQRTIEAGITPQHGLGRNIWPGYVQHFLGIDSSDIYGILLNSKIYLGLAAPLMVFTIIAISKRILLGLGLFACFTLGFIFNPQDLNIAWFLMLYIVAVLPDKFFQNQKFRLFLVLIYVLSINYSIETLLFGILSFILVNVLAGFKWWKEILSFLGFLTVLSIFPLYRGQWQLMQDALTQDGNLLERSVSLFFNTESFFITISFALILLLVKQVIKNLYQGVRDSNYRDNLILVLIVSGLLMLTRGFNRADAGHLIYGLQFLPFVLLALAVRNKQTETDSDIGPWVAFRLANVSFIFLIISGLVLTSQTQPRVFSTSNFYGLTHDTKIPGKILFDKFTIPDNNYFSYMPDLSKNLENLKILRDKRVLDFSNNLTSSIVLGGARITETPITLLVGSGTGETSLVNRVNSKYFDYVIWSSLHWTEDLDGVTSEDRLPGLASAILKSYPYFQKFGNFVILQSKKTQNNFQLNSISKSNIRWNYTLGFAPGMTKPMSYKGFEYIEFFAAARTNVAYTAEIICSAPSAAQQLRFNFNIKAKGGTNVINLSNRLSYLLLSVSGVVNCKSTDESIENIRILKN